MRHRKTFRSQNGVVYTPNVVALSLVDFVKNLRGKDFNAVLEPSAGDGVFLSALKAKGFALKNVTAIDKSKIAYRKLELAFPYSKVKHEDFINYANSIPQQKYDLIIGNPPYVRRSNMTSAGRRSVDKLDNQNEMHSGSLVNLWAAFVKAAVDVSTEDAIIAFVLPYEMLNNKYGVKLQNWLVSQIGSLDIFISRQRAFAGIDQDAIIAVIDRKGLNRGLRIHYVEDFSNLKTDQRKNSQSTVDTTCALSRHSFLLDCDTISLLKRLSVNLRPATQFCTNSTGIVTGANKYFIMSRDDVEKFGLHQYVKPIIQKASDMPNTVIIDGTDSAHTYTRYLIDFEGLDTYDLSDKAVSYIRYVANEGVASRYKCRVRDPWYQVPILDSAPLYFFKRSHQKLKFVRNYTDIRITDTAYRIYPKPEIDADSLQLSFYNSLTSLFSEIEGRFYGGGVLEVTPNEFRKIPIVYEPLSNGLKVKRQQELEAYIRNSSRIFQHGDMALKRNLQMNDDEIIKIQNAYLTLQNHRLRHGGKQSIANVH